MAITYWTGATDGDPSDDGNWSGVKPANGDTAIIDTGSRDIEANDQSAVTATLIVVGPNYKGNIGSGTGTPYQINATTLIVAGGGGKQHFKGTYGTVVVEKVGTGTQNLYLDGGTTTLALIHQGTVGLLGGTYTTLFADPIGGIKNNVYIDVVAATVTTLNQRQGTTKMADSAGTITTANIDAGSLDVTAGTLTNLYQRNGATIWQTGDGALAIAVIYDGTFDASGDVHPKTITNLTAYGAARLNLSNGAGNIMLANDLIDRGYDVRTNWPTAKTISYA